MFFRRVGILGMLLLGAGCAPVKHDPVIVPLVIVSRPPPHFPLQAIREAHEGTVIVLILVGVKGTPLNAWIEKSSGYRELDRAAIASARHWTFKPRTIDGVPTESYARVPVTFDFGAQRKEIQMKAASRLLLRDVPGPATPFWPPAQN